jgi:glycosyltransferase involved in cell wall biosynthesis/peptidoglycan/xylan/chitin deacetylase (PgdA/CDA1 family)
MPRLHLAGGCEDRQSVLIIAATLDYGGAEVTCVELARHLHQKYRVEVIALLNDGPAADEIRAAGIPVLALRANTVWRKLTTCSRLIGILRAQKPEFVITFLYLSDLIGGVFAKILIPKSSVFWNIRNNVLARSQMGRYTYIASKLGAVFSRIVPHTIVYCSPLAKAQHEAIGYRCNRSIVVENSMLGVPFSFSAERRAAFRAGRFENDFVFLFVGTFTQIKRVDLFIEACAVTHRLAGSSVKFAIAGRNMQSGNAQLMRLIEGTNISSDCFALLGHVSDRQQLFSGADCLIVTSESEGSPNVVFEAMATDLPVIIYGTKGTEHLAARGVSRIPERRMEALVAAMQDTLSRGASARAPAPSGDGVSLPAAREHPLVTYYKRAMTGSRTIAFNLSVDFEMGWGDLERLANDDVFYRRVIEGNAHVMEVIQLLGRLGLQSTWGVVGACSYADIGQLRDRAPRSFQAIEGRLKALSGRRADYLQALFCPGTVEAISRAAHIELGSHGFLHLEASQNPPATLQEDVIASVRALRQISGKAVQSFIPPRNFYWPDEVFSETQIKYVRHAPRILGRTYSDIRTPARLARLWNDFIRPTRAESSMGEAALLIYLRLDRGASLWNSQLRLLRRLLHAGSGMLYCYTHPHNLDTRAAIWRLQELCELVGEYRERNKLICPPFAREVGIASASAVPG